MLGSNNPAIQEKIDQLFSEILKENSNLKAVKGPDADKKDVIEKTLMEYKEVRGKPIFFNYLSSGKGNGPLTELIDGSVKYDLIGGIGVYLLGHGHPLHIRSNLEAATFDEIMVGNLQPYGPAIELSKNIVSCVSGSKLKYFWFAGSGSFANDTALKMIWQKMAPKYKVIAFDKVFAGRSIGTQCLTYNTAYREGMPKSLHAEYAPHFDATNPENSIQKTIKALDEIWAKDPDSYACLTMELVQGEGGFIFGPKEWYEAVFKWAKEKGIYIWIDEVQTFGRTGELFAFQSFGLEEYVDIVTVGKALQVCGVLFGDELNPKPGLIAGTFNGSISAIKMADKTLTYLKEGNFFGENGRVNQIGQEFNKRLTNLMNGSCKGKIKYVCSKGVMVAFEVGNSDKDDTVKFVKAMYDNGILCFNAGKDPMRVRFLLPISIEDEQIDDIFSIIEKTVKQVFGE